MRALADNLIKSLKNPAVATIFSIVLGLGIASMFRPLCKDGVCEIIRGPSPQSLAGNVYQFGTKCYLYESHAVECASNAI